MREPRRLTTVWASTACYRDSFTVYLFYYHLCLGLRSHLFTSDCPTITVNKVLTSRMHATGLKNLILTDLITLWQRVQIRKLVMHSSSISCYLYALQPVVNTQ
jgi:hypothetical protein